MRKALLFISLVVICGASIEEDEKWVFYQPLKDYLACMSKYSKATYVDDMRDTYVARTRTVPDRSKAKVVIKFKKDLMSDTLENKEDGMMPVSFKTTVTSSSTAMKQDVSGTTVGLSASAGASAGKFGFSVSGSFEKGGLQNNSQISQNITQQSWDRSFKVPPHMKVTRKMSLYEKTITMPGVFQTYITGYLPIKFENVKESKYRELWKECGVSIPKPVLGSGEKVFAVKVENLIPTVKLKKESWKRNADGSVSIDIMKEENGVTEIKEFVRMEKHVILDPKIKMTEYCDSIDPEKETDPVTKNKMEKGDQVTKVEGNVDVNQYNFNANFGGDDDDDDKDKKKPKKNKKRPKKKKHGK